MRCVDVYVEVSTTHMTRDCRRYDGDYVNKDIGDGYGFKSYSQFFSFYFTSHIFIQSIIKTYPIYFLVLFDQHFNFKNI